MPEKKLEKGDQVVGHVTHIVRIGVGVLALGDFEREAKPTPPLAGPAHIGKAMCTAYSNRSPCTPSVCSRSPKNLYWQAAFPSYLRRIEPILEMYWATWSNEEVIEYRCQFIMEGL